MDTNRYFVRFNNLIIEKKKKERVTLIYEYLKNYKRI